MAKRLNILFVTRKFPPSTGGMENAAYALYSALAEKQDVTLIKYGGKNKFLPVVYPVLLVRALFKGYRNRPDVIYLQDGLMAPLGWILQKLLKRPTIMTIHGLEATYHNPLYRLMVTPFISRQNKLVAVSNETKQKVVRALPRTNPEVIFNGLRDDFYEPKNRTEQLTLIAQKTKIPLERLEKSKVLYTNGRLVRRKGVAWFVNNVMPELSPDVLYFVSGSGKDKETIEDVITKYGLLEQVFLLGRVSGDLRNALYNAADIFVMPNVPVLNDMEGFGLVALEAASCGTLVVASQLEGIQDAIIDGKNGVLVEPKNAEMYVRTIKRELTKPSLTPQKIRRYSLDHYSWAETARQYEALMQGVIAANR